jgi:hypothetical protein
MAETNDRQQELEALHRSYKMMEMDRQKYSEESQVRRRSLALPPARVVPGRGHAMAAAAHRPTFLRNPRHAAVVGRMAAARTCPGDAHAS